MKIALDYDNTITRDPAFWTKFCELAKVFGHSVTVVTSRFPNTLGSCEIPIVYCSFTAKRKHFDADVWIDDDPKHIDMDHEKIP